MQEEPTSPQGFADLLSRHPWPSSPPCPEAPLVGRDSPGFEMLYEAIESLGDQSIVMEIGSEFGGSTRKFLTNTSAYVVSVDRWPDNYKIRKFPEIHDYLERPRGAYDLFLTFCWEYRSRLATVRERSPAGPVTVRDAGVDVNFIYIDGDHRYDAVMRDLTIADALFPSAIIAGDDWLWNKGNKSRFEHMVVPVQLAVISWAAFNNVHIDFDGNTWLLDKSKPYNLDPPETRFRGSQAVARRLSRMQRTLDSVEKSLSKPDLPTRVYRKLKGIGRK